MIRFSDGDRDGMIVVKGTVLRIPALDRLSKKTKLHVSAEDVFSVLQRWYAERGKYFAVIQIAAPVTSGLPSDGSSSYVQAKGFFLAEQVDLPDEVQGVPQELEMEMDVIGVRNVELNPPGSIVRGESGFSAMDNLQLILNVQEIEERVLRDWHAARNVPPAKQLLNQSTLDPNFGRAMQLALIRKQWDGETS